MRKLTLLPALLLALVLVGCAGNPIDTPNERVFAAELALNGALHELNLQHELGTFTPEQWQEIQGHLRTLALARETMWQLYEQGVSPQRPIQTIYAVLLELRPYLRTEP